jgi:1-pyrroline-5-carboxylate dehydrogenase
MDAATKVPFPHNEKVLDYAPGSEERKQLEARLEELGSERHELTMTIDGQQRMGSGRKVKVVAPHARRQVLGTLGTASKADAQAAVDAA